MYKLDTKAAVNADNTGKWLNETGKYIGTVVSVEDIKAASQTRGVVVTLITDDKRETKQYIYTVKEDGTQLSGYDLLMSMMTVLRLKTINPMPGQVKRWDTATRQEFLENATIFPEFSNKRIGFLLQRTEEESRKNPGETAWTAKIVGFFDPVSELVAAEILKELKVPAILPRRVAMLTDRPMRRNAPRAGSGHTPRDAGGGGFDDDIPFSPAYPRAAWSII